MSYASHQFTTASARGFLREALEVLATTPGNGKKPDKRELEQALVDVEAAKRVLIISLSELEKSNSRVESAITNKYIVINDNSLTIYDPLVGGDVISVGKDGLLKLRNLINERFGQ